MGVRTLSLMLLALSPAGGAAQDLVGRSMAFDIGAFAGDEVRLGLEPVVAGRWTLQVGLARWTGGGPPVAGDFVRTAEGGVAQSGLVAVPGRTELALDLSLRWYPARLESRHPDRRFSVYVGAGAGLTQRTDAVAFGFRDPMVERTTEIGVDPLAEAGVRFRPAGPLLLDVGARARLVSSRDPTNRFAAGDIVPRVVVGLGFAW